MAVAAGGAIEVAWPVERPFCKGVLGQAVKLLLPVAAILGTGARQEIDLFLNREFRRGRGRRQAGAVEQAEQFLQQQADGMAIAYRMVEGKP